MTICQLPDPTRQYEPTQKGSVPVSASRQICRAASALLRCRSAKTTAMSSTCCEALSVDHDRLLSTGEAGRLVGRTDSAVRHAVRLGLVEGLWNHSHWLVRASAVIAWADAHKANPAPRTAKPRTEDVAELLSDYGSASAEEVAAVLEVHPGNARKYLALLAVQGRAQRRKDGQWVLVGAEPLAS